MKAKKVILFSASNWAFGAIHYDLTKFLFLKNIEAELLPWQYSYSLDEFRELNTTTDVFMTTTYGAPFLTNDYGIDPAKIVAVAHGTADLTSLIEQQGVTAFDKFRRFVVVSEFLKERSQQLGIKRIPEIATIGINYERFNISPSKELKTVGYAGDFNGFHKVLKRGQLAEQAAQLAGLEFKVAQSYHNTFITMPGFYNSVDCILIPSEEEAAGLPALEGGAAGRLVISTPVGHWQEKVGKKGGIAVSIDSKKFVSETVKWLTHYKQSPKEYREKCKIVKEHAKTYDWSKVIDQWVAVLD